MIPPVRLWEGYEVRDFPGLNPTHIIPPLNKSSKQKKPTTLVAGINPKKTALQNIKAIVN